MFGTEKNIRPAIFVNKNLKLVDDFSDFKQMVHKSHIGGYLMASVVNAKLTLSIGLGFTWYSNIAGLIIIFNKVYCFTLKLDLKCL